MAAHALPARGGSRTAAARGCRQHTPASPPTTPRPGWAEPQPGLPARKPPRGGGGLPRGGAPLPALRLFRRAGGDRGGPGRALRPARRVRLCPHGSVLAGWWCGAGAGGCLGPPPQHVLESGALKMVPRRGTCAWWRGPLARLGSARLPPVLPVFTRDPGNGSLHLGAAAAQT